MSTIGIVTVLYNSERVLNDFFLTLNKQTNKDFTLYVVDNASTDNGLKKAIELSKTVSFRCEFFKEKENGGIARGNNIGIKSALKDGCEFVLLSNNDVVFEDKNTIQVMIDRYNSTKADIITPKIKKYSNTDCISL